MQWWVVSIVDEGVLCLIYSCGWEGGLVLMVYVMVSLVLV